jgi:hypothetical protein
VNETMAEANYEARKILADEGLRNGRAGAAERNAQKVIYRPDKGIF